MVKPIIFWLGLAGVLVSWELVFFDASRVGLWLFLCLISSVAVSFRLTEHEDSPEGAHIDRLAVALFSVGAFWWFLWIDFPYFKYVAPIAVWLGLVYAISRNHSKEHISAAVRLMLFFGGTFFWAVTSFGLLTVIGWQLWQTLLVFMASFGPLAYAGIRTLRSQKSDTMRAWLVLLLLGVELFSVVAWLPFTEVTLALILTVLVLFVYDFIKYYLYPDRIRTKIIVKKLVVYAFFLLIVLVSTPWV